MQRTTAWTIDFKQLLEKTMKSLKILLFNLFIFLLLFALVELIFQLTNPNYQYYYRTHQGQPDLSEVLSKNNSDWLRIDDELGWTCQQKSQLQFPSPPVTGINYQINEEGFRMPFNLKDTIPKGKKKILLLGDSFIFGVYLKEDETISAQLKKAKGEEYVFYTIAIPAWGLDQMYLAYQKYVDLIKPDQVVLAFIDDDLMRSLEILFHGCGRKPCLKLKGNELVPNNDPPALWEYLCWNNQIGNRLLLAHYQRKAVELCSFYLEDIIENERAAGRKPAFIRIPTKIDLDQKEPRSIFSMQSFMDQKGVRYKELYTSISKMKPINYHLYYIPNDGHFTAMGAAMCAMELEDMID